MRNWITHKLERAKAEKTESEINKTESEINKTEKTKSYDAQNTESDADAQVTASDNTDSGMPENTSDAMPVNTDNETATTFMIGEVEVPIAMRYDLDHVDYAGLMHGKNVRVLSNEKWIGNYQQNLKKYIEKYKSKYVK